MRKKKHLKQSQKCRYYFSATTITLLLCLNAIIFDRIVHANYFMYINMKNKITKNPHCQRKLNRTAAYFLRKFKKIK